MTRSEDLFEQAKKTIPGGVNSPVRAFNGVGGSPRFIEKADGAYIYDADGKAYIDYVGSWGPMILGHNHPKIREAFSRRWRTVCLSVHLPSWKCRWQKKSLRWCLP